MRRNFSYAGEYFFSNRQAPRYASGQSQVRRTNNFILQTSGPALSSSPMATREQQRVSARATGIVGVAILCSRLLGLVREMVIASLFGASRNLDAFLTAFRAPNMLRDLFAEGALSTAFVTTFSKKIQTEGDQSAWALANKSPPSRPFS